MSEENKPPQASVTITPPKFQKKEPLTPEQQYEAVLKEIEEAKQKGKKTVIINYDLYDLAWQKLSQAGYKLHRTLLPKLSSDKYSTAGELDPNRVQFEIDLTEKNRTDC